MTHEASRPVVSIVMPLYNKEEWIEDTLSSLLAQTFPLSELELIIVDDGSTDSGPQRAAALLAQHPLPHEIIRVQSGGPSRARNIGWKRAKADWIQFLDADDILYSRKIATQVRHALQSDPAVAVVYSEWQLLDLAQDYRTDPRGRRFSPHIGADPASDLLSCPSFLQIASILVRREWLARVSGFQESLRLIEEVDLQLRIAFAGGQFLRASIGEPLAGYRVTQESVSRYNPVDFMNACVRNAQLAESQWMCQGGLTHAQKMLLTDIYFGAAHFFALHDWRRFKEVARKLDTLGSPFVPVEPPYLRRITRLAGYEFAERVARLPRRIKHRLTRLPIGRRKRA